MSPSQALAPIGPVADVYRPGRLVLALRGFTIIELLVSIGIFVVSATLMLGALFGATEVFRRGEAARQAGDEATAVIAALQEDFSRTVPIRLRDGKPAPEWGRLYAKAQDNGNCMLAFVIENPDRSQVRWINEGDPVNKRLVGVRSWVVWQVITSTSADDELWREEWDMAEDGRIVDAAGVLQTLNFVSSGSAPRKEELVTRGCLHFGAWVEVAQAHRLMKEGSAGPEFGWESTSTTPDERVIPFAGTAFDTADPVVDPNGNWFPQPDALRVSLVLTGGSRFATRGTLVRDMSDADLTARISGIRALPTTSGSLLRIDNEWVRYDDFRNGQVTIRSDGRGALRSTASAHSGRVTVLAGQPFSLVVALSR